MVNIIEPNNPMLKIIFLIVSWLIIFIPCFSVAKEILFGFKQAKLHAKILKILGIIPFFTLCFAVTFVVIERMINFDLWHIGGSN